MFVSDALKTHLESSSTVQLKSLVLAEWNMNMPDNIQKIGNYRYRPTGTDSKFKTIPNTFDSADAAGYYTGATEADITIDGGYDDQDQPQTFTSKKEKMNMIYSLEDCLKPFRPRSGVNKMLYFTNKYLANSSSLMSQRPRYYMPSRYDQFKYWTSYRTESTTTAGITTTSERGISSIKSGTQFYIDDAAPFVVYKENVPANRIIVKMQTNVGDINLGPFTSSSGTFQDPLYGESKKTTPSNWKIQYLEGNNWVTAKSFTPTTLRENGNPIIGTDGYVELQYGVILDQSYMSRFIYQETLSSSTQLPTKSFDGYAYLVISNTGERGVFHIWNSTTSTYDQVIPQYGWKLAEETINNESSFVKDLTSPISFINEADGQNVYREFQNIRGIRIVVDTMNKFDCTFDLIEMSPRLVVDVSDKVTSFRINKSLSDLGSTSLPVEQILASTGEISLFDDDQAFNANNTSSIVYKYIRKNIKFKFYETVVNVEGYDYFVPIKTLYSEGFPQADVNAGTVSVTLRDLYFFLESMPAPRLLVTEASLSYAITLLLDYVGFTNYTFLRVAGESDPIIPYFFVAPDQNVAEVLNQLAVSTQSSMYFDEYNNFVVMSKDYLMPNATQRPTDFTISGSNNQTDSGVIENSSSGKLPNIISIASEDKKIFNAGKINYTTRYIQRSYGSRQQASLIDQEKTWIYKPALLWEVSGTETTKTINEIASTQGSYILGAMPINSDITSNLPTVVKNQIVDNIIDLGEYAYWLTRYNGYLYSNGEIIKYDAAEFSLTIALWYDKKTDGTPDYTKQYFVEPGNLAPSVVVADLNTQVKSGAISQSEADKTIDAWKTTHIQGSSNVWISSNQEYQKYFAALPFNGKIYPTGRVRIYTVPYYETVGGITKMANGQVLEHGRAQFGTSISKHTAGIDPHWSNNDNVRGCDMQSQYLFTTDPNTTVPASVVGVAGVNSTLAKQTTRNGIIRNFMALSGKTETEVNSFASTRTGTVQSSALVMNGPTFKTTENALNFVSYVYKPLNNAYKHFGTRLRVIGKIENNETRAQTPTGSTSYYQVTGSLTSQSVSIGGGSGGLAVLLNPETNNGYYFEIVALTESNIESYIKTNSDGTEEAVVHNVLFYKIKKDSSSSNAIPIKLWGGLAGITVDDGSFIRQYRMTAEGNPTVYDLSVEYKEIGNTRRFYLYINNNLVKIVDDTDPLPVYNNMALFTRGSSRMMFENIYALSENYAQNTVFTVSDTIAQAFGDNSIDVNESFRKYAMSGIVQSTYLSGISAQEPPRYSMYFEEFGSIMRECAYFDIKYDRAYPALYAQMSPTFSRIKGYTTSGFQADSYGAEFLIFNATDKALSLDETTGNFLRIQGITFTQNTTHQLTVDEYFSKRSSQSDPELKGDVVLTSPYVEKEKYNMIKQSRMIYGNNEFSIDAPYIQTDDSANSLMSWITNKLMVPKRSVGVNIFSVPTLQLGDIVNIDYKNKDNLNVIGNSLARFVIYNIEYSRNLDGPSMSIYLSEV